MQEGLTNALRYAHGSRVDVEVTGDARTLSVRVQDHGGAASPRSSARAPASSGSASGCCCAADGCVRATTARATSWTWRSRCRTRSLPGEDAAGKGTRVIRVLLVDDQHLVREGFARLLRDVPDIEVVGEAADGASAVAQALEARPDLVLMDVRMPGMDGLEATAQITRSVPDARVLMLTTFDLDEAVHRALEAGASGFLLKDTPYEQLIHAIRVVAQGDSVLAPSVTRRLIESFAPPQPTEPDAARLSRLTDRESGVLRSSPRACRTPRSARCSS